MTYDRILRPCLLVLVASTTVAARPPRAIRPVRSWVALEASKAIITKIDVEVVDVFDLSLPAEGNWLGRLADHLHKSTREIVIRRVLLFKEGDQVRTRRIYETERLLRALPYLKDAHINPVLQPDGTLVARVVVRDAWTTQLNAGFSSVGGQKTMNFGLAEQNFLGLGKSVTYNYTKDFQRSTWGFGYLDPQFLGSRWTLAAQDQYLSDGMARSFSFGRPFFALDTPWSTSLTMAQKRTTLNLYDRGAKIFQAPFIQNEVQWTGAMAFPEAGDRVWRAGLLVDRQDTQYGPLTSAVPATLPPGPAQLAPDPLTAPTLTNHRLRGNALTLATEKDAFDTFKDLLGMDTPEDYNLSWNGNLALGVYSRSLGSTVTAPFYTLQLSNGWSSALDNLTLLAFNASGRVPATGQENAQVNLLLTQYCMLTPSQILAGLVAVDVGRRLDPENWYYLGGDQGLRGYPNQLHPGEARWVTSVDYRLLTEQRWWGIVRLGFSAFFDAGSIRQMDGLGWSKTYSDVGVGLRLGNLKSSLGRVIVVNVAKPLNREPYQSKLQFTVGNTMRF